MESNKYPDIDDKQKKIDSLWQVHEPPLSSLYKKEHSYYNFINNPMLLTASVRGRSHEHKGTFRDDHSAIEYLSDSGWSILTVADGAGSCQYSRQGSKIAIEEIIKNIKQCSELKDTNAVDTAIYDINKPENLKYITSIIHSTLYLGALETYKALESFSKKEGINVKDLSTTLLIALHKKVKGKHFIATFSIGDGLIGLYDKNNSIKLLSEPESGEFAGQTRFLDSRTFTPSEYESRIKMTVADDSNFTALILMTDGISDPKFDSSDLMKDIKIWDGLWEELSSEINKLDLEQSAKNICEWLKFKSPGHHDDRSISFLYNGGFYE